MKNVLADLLEALDVTTSLPGIQTASSSLRLELINGFLFLIGVYALVVFVPFLRFTWRTKQRNPAAEAVYLHLIGHTLFRGWSWLSWHSINDGWDIVWMSYFPVWDVSGLIIGVSIIWIAECMARRTLATFMRGWLLPFGLALAGTLVLRAL